MARFGQGRGGTGLRGARADRRRSGRPAHRHLLAGRGRLRDAHRQGPVRGSGRRGGRQRLLPHPLQAVAARARGRSGGLPASVGPAIDRAMSKEPQSRFRRTPGASCRPSGSTPPGRRPAVAPARRSCRRAEREERGEGRQEGRASARPGWMPLRVRRRASSSSCSDHRRWASAYAHGRHRGGGPGTTLAVDRDAPRSPRRCRPPRTTTEPSTTHDRHHRGSDHHRRRRRPPPRPRRTTTTLPPSAPPPRSRRPPPPKTTTTTAQKTVTITVTDCQQDLQRAAQHPSVTTQPGRPERQLQQLTDRTRARTR